MFLREACGILSGNKGEGLKPGMGTEFEGVLVGKEGSSLGPAGICMSAERDAGSGKEPIVKFPKGKLSKEVLATDALEGAAVDARAALVCAEESGKRADTAGKAVEEIVTGNCE